MVIYNCHGRRRQELVTFRVSLTNIKVYYMEVTHGDSDDDT